MVDFNDRRLTEDQKTPYVRPDVDQAVKAHLEQGSTHRVSLAFNAPTESGDFDRVRKSGYLRADESGKPTLYHNARSTRGEAIDVPNLYSINSSRRERGTGVQGTYWQRLSAPYSLLDAKS